MKQRMSRKENALNPRFIAKCRYTCVSTGIGLVLCCSSLALSGAAAWAQQSPQQPANVWQGSPIERVIEAMTQPGDAVSPPGDAAVGEPVPRAERERGGVTTIRGGYLPVAPAATTPFTATPEQPIVYSEVPASTGTITLPGGLEPQRVVDLLVDLYEATDWNIVPSPGLEDVQVRLFAHEVTPAQLLDLLKFHGIFYEFDLKTNTLYIMLIEEYMSREYGAIHHEAFPVEHADVLTLEGTLRTLLSQSGRLVADPRTGNILVWDTASNLAEMRDAVAKLDVPLEPRVFELEYLDAELVVESVESLLSETGIAHADPRMNAIVVTDLPSRQDQIAQLLDTLDNKLET
ncbi:MAG: hypothetical protein KJ052_17720, partial [Candidatus Hydrogenedentes bacterium]|nr:hypothetical protein [Candidatus Hydrogenedentota bacterium]